ncbi:MAG: hypothetical protein HIU81_13155 [Acidobacteria bacterium]|nr:hypothetical protein [Acidobacteriota bacterium]
MTDQHFGPSSTSGTSSATSVKAAGEPSHAVVGSFTLRDLVVLAGVLVVFAGSLAPIIRQLGYSNFWNGSGLFYLVLGVLLPLSVGVLFVTRRVSPESTLRVGSLSVDQFASVVSAYAVGYFFWGLVATTSWGFIIGFIGAATMLAATTFGPLIPMFAGDFAGRVSAPAHRVALDAVPANPVLKSETSGSSASRSGTGAHGVAGSAAASGSADAVPGPAMEQPVQSATPEVDQFLGGAAAGAERDEARSQSDSAHEAEVAEDSGQLNEPASGTFGSPADEASALAAEQSSDEANTETSINPAVHSGTGASAFSETPTPAAKPESIGASKDPATQPETGSHAVYDAFWFAVDKPRAVVDEKTGAFLYNLEPGNWILALADRGHDFLVQNTDGRVGVLRDLSSIERAPEGE